MSPHLSPLYNFSSISSDFGEDWGGNFPLKSQNISLALTAVSHPSPVSNISCPEFVVREQQTCNWQSGMSSLKSVM